MTKKKHTLGGKKDRLLTYLKRKKTEFYNALGKKDRFLKYPRRKRQTLDRLLTYPRTSVKTGRASAKSLLFKFI